MFFWASMPLAGIFCFPRAGEFWDGNLLLRCQRLAIVGPVQGVVGLAADIFILVLPLPIVYKMNLAPRRKIGLAAVFLAGVLYVSLRSAGPVHADPEQCRHCQCCIIILPSSHLQRARHFLVYSEHMGMRVSGIQILDHHDRTGFLTKRLTSSSAWQKVMSPLSSAAHPPSPLFGPILLRNRPFMLVFGPVVSSQVQRAPPVRKPQVPVSPKSPCHFPPPHIMRTITTTTMNSTMWPILHLMRMPIPVERSHLSKQKLPSSRPLLLRR